MALTKQEFLDTLTNIGTCADETERRTMLASLNDEAALLFDNNATLTSQNEALTADNESIRAANMKLFLQVGSNKTDAQRQQDTTGHHDEPEQRIKYEDLFNEEGGLK